jgi:hypothetical protein
VVTLIEIGSCNFRGSHVLRRCQQQPRGFLGKAEGIVDPGLVFTFICRHRRSISLSFGAPLEQETEQNHEQRQRDIHERYWSAAGDIDHQNLNCEKNSHNAQCGKATDISEAVSSQIYAGTQKSFAFGFYFQGDPTASADREGNQMEQTQSLQRNRRMEQNQSTVQNQSASSSEDSDADTPDTSWRDSSKSAKESSRVSELNADFNFSVLLWMSLLLLTWRRSRYHFVLIICE